MTEFELTNGKANEVEVARASNLQHERLTALKTPSGLSKNPEHGSEVGPDSIQRMVPVSEDEMSAVSVGQ